MIYKSLKGTDALSASMTAAINTLIANYVKNNEQDMVITGGTIDNTVIGSVTPSSGAFTSLSATGTSTLGHVIVNGNELSTSSGGLQIVPVTFASLPASIPLQFGNTTESISGDGSGHLAIAAATSLNIAPAILSADTTASSSSTVGAVQLSGGLSIALNTDATSSANGGSFTTAGGMGIGGKLISASSAHFGGEIFETRTVQNLSSATGLNLTASQVIGSVIYRAGEGVGVTDTLPDAASLVAAIPAVAIGTSWILMYVNTSSTNSITLAAGTGGTWVGTGGSASSATVATQTGIKILFLITNITSGTEAYDVILG